MTTHKKQQKHNPKSRILRTDSNSILRPPLMEPIHILVTGGSIDSVFKAELDTVVPRKTSILPAYFASIKPYFDFTITRICMKDSRHLTLADRRKLLDAILKSEFANLLVTHGTYTMPDTAKYLSAQLPAGHGKTVILTGSMIPLDGFTMSDASFNLGFAIASFAYLDSGVYVCMNGKIFTPDEVIKDLHISRFASILGEK